MKNFRWTVRTGVNFSEFYVFRRMLMIYGLLLLLSMFLPNDLSAWDEVCFLGGSVGLSVLVFVCPWFCCRVIFERERITVQWIGIRLYALPTADLRLMCFVSDNEAGQICLTIRNPEELVAEQEKRYERSPIKKHELAFLRRQGDWKNILLREQFLWLRKHPMQLLRRRDSVAVPMNVTLLTLLRKAYPQAAYRNLMGRQESCRTMEEKQMCTFRPGQTCCRAEVQTEGISVATKKKTLFFLPKQEIQTILRVDYFGCRSRYLQYHECLLMVTTMTAAEMAQEGKRLRVGGMIPDVQDREILLAQEYALHRFARWNAKQTDWCQLLWTEKLENQLRSIYPHAQWIDLSDCWEA